MASWTVDKDVILTSERSLLSYVLDLHRSCWLRDALLRFKLIREDQIGVPQQVFVRRYNIPINVELSLIAHNRIKHCHL